MTEFQDIKITEMDKRASKKSGKFPTAFDVAIGLSDRPPAEWEQIFAAAWKAQWYSLKRHAHIEDSNIIITCAIDEVEKNHLPMLKSAVAETNRRYRGHLAKQIDAEKREKAKAAAKRDELSALEKSLTKI